MDIKHCGGYEPILCLYELKSFLFFHTPEMLFYQDQMSHQINLPYLILLCSTFLPLSYYIFYFYLSIASGFDHDQLVI